jgi:hypothetical protein
MQGGGYCFAVSSGEWTPLVVALRWGQDVATLYRVRQQSPSWSPAGDGSVILFLAVSEMNGQHAPPTGDHEGPPNPTSSSLAPTDGAGLFLRLMPIGADESAVCAINRHLRLFPHNLLTPNTFLLLYKYLMLSV